MIKIYLFIKNLFLYYITTKFKIILNLKQRIGVNKHCNRIHKNHKYFYQVKLKKDWIQKYELNNILNMSFKEAYSYNDNSLNLLKEKKISIGLSTGTSGLSTPFISSENDRINWFISLYVRLFPISYIRPIKISFFLKYNNSLYTDTAKKSFIKIKYFDANVDVPKYINNLLMFNPNVIVAPSQTIKKIMNTNLNFSNLNKFVSVTEKLDIIDKKYFKNIELKEIYQATEGFLGVSCKYGKIHLNEDLMIIEKYVYYFNNIKYFFPVITDFTREAQIVSRLVLDDFLEESLMKCRCKNNYISLESVDSRLSDLVIYYDKNSFYLMPSNVLIKIILKYIGHENDFNIVQIKINSFIISFSREILIKNKFYIKEEIKKIINADIDIIWRIILKKDFLFHKKRRVISLIKKELVISNENEKYNNFIKLIPESSNILLKNKNFNYLPNCYIIIHL